VDTISRAVATAAEAALAVLGADGLGLLTAGWQTVAVTGALAGVVTILRCVAKPGDLLPESVYQGKHVKTGEAV
jgi:hypothetical protein